MSMRVILSLTLYDPEQTLDNHVSAGAGGAGSSAFETTELVTLDVRTPQRAHLDLMGVLIRGGTKLQLLETCAELGSQNGAWN